MSNVKESLLHVIGEYLDSIGMSKVKVDIHMITPDSASVYITVPAGFRDEVDEVAIYNDIADDEQLAYIDIELDIIDEGEIKDELEGSIIDPDMDDAEEDDEDELAADNLTVLDPDGGREIHLRDLRDDEEDEYDDDEEEDEDDNYSIYDEDDDIDGIDEYEPTWSDLEEVMRGSDEDY